MISLAFSIGQQCDEKARVSVPKQKSLVNLFKGCGCGQRPQNFMLSQIFLIAKWLIWRLNITARACKLQQQEEKVIFIIYAVIATQ